MKARSEGPSLETVTQTVRLLPGLDVVMSTLGTGAGDLEPSAVAGGLVPEHTFAEILLDSTVVSYYKIGNPAILPACLS